MYHKKAAILISQMKKHCFMTYQHSVRVAEITQIVGTTPHEKQLLYFCGLLHDIGKVAIPVNLLHKKNTLTEAETAVIQTHTTIGRDILQRNDFPENIISAVYFHHERGQGKGYPCRLIDIPYEAKVVAVADVFAALTEKRSYRKALSLKDAIEMLTLQSEQGLIDATITDIIISQAMQRIRTDNAKLYQSYKIHI